MPSFLQFCLLSCFWSIFCPRGRHGGVKTKVSCEKNRRCLEEHQIVGVANIAPAWVLAQAACPKHMAHGPCAGVTDDGGCEVPAFGPCPYTGEWPFPDQRPRAARRLSKPDPRDAGIAAAVSFAP